MNNSYIVYNGSVQYARCKNINVPNCVQSDMYRYKHI